MKKALDILYSIKQDHNIRFLEDTIDEAIKELEELNEIEYLNKAKRTLSTSEDLIEHMAYGLVTESSEILDALKKHKFYKRELNIQNLKEECGDLMWYLYQLIESLDYTPQQCRNDNILKLQKRYPDKFQDVVIRNVDIELEHIK